MRMMAVTVTVRHGHFRRRVLVDSLGDDTGDEEMNYPDRTRLQRNSYAPYLSGVYVEVVMHTTFKLSVTVH